MHFKGAASGRARRCDLPPGRSGRAATKYYSISMRIIISIITNLNTTTINSY